MKVWGMVLGGYPRGRWARHALRDLERGVITRPALEEALLAAHAEVIGAQKAAGLPVVVDGMIDWHDIFRPFVRAWRNVAVDGLLRYFDNNFFYRIPVFTGEPDVMEPVLPGRVRLYAPLAHPAGLKVVVPGPVTLVRLSRNRSGLDDAELAEKVASALRVEVEGAFREGASMVQVDEPFLADVDATRDDAVLARELVGKIVQGYEGKSVLAVYFNFPDKSVYEELLDAPTRYLALDIADYPARALEVIEAKGLGGHVPALGVIDARRIYDDNLEEILGWLKRVVGGEAEETVLTTSSWLDLIPHRYGLRKTILLGRLVERAAERLGWEPVTLTG